MLFVSAIIVLWLLLLNWWYFLFFLNKNKKLSESFSIFYFYYKYQIFQIVKQADEIMISTYVFFRIQIKTIRPSHGVGTNQYNHLFICDWQSIAQFNKFEFKHIDYYTSRAYNPTKFSFYLILFILLQMIFILFNFEITI